MTDELWHILHERLLIDRQPWLRLTEQDIQLPDGRIIQGFLKLSAPDYASIFAVTDEGMILTVEEYKHGPERVLLKLPSGFLEPDETPLNGAKRELLEETGYEAREWRFLGKFHDDGNRGMSQGHHFLALGLRKVAEPDAGDLSDVVPGLTAPADLREAILAGRVGESGTAAGMLLGLDALRHGIFD